MYGQDLDFILTGLMVAVACLAVIAVIEYAKGGDDDRS